MRVYLKKLPLIFCLFCTFLLFFSCQTDTKNGNILKAGISQNQFPKLLNRSAAIQMGKEWDNVQNQYAAALKALKSDKKDFDASLKMVEVFILEARVTGEHGHYYPAALELLDGILSQNPDSKDIQFRVKSYKASVLLSQHEFEEALVVGKEAAKLYDYNAGIYGSLTDANVELGNYEEAIKMADKMTSIRPDLRSYSRVSYLREIHGDMVGAIEAMQLAVSAGYPGYEQSAWARLTLGNLYKKKGDLDAAEGEYNTILQERPNYPFAVAALADVSKKRGNVTEAEKLLKAACAIIPEVGFYIELATLYQETDRKKEATALVKDILIMLEEDVQSGHNMNLEYCELYLNLIADYEIAADYAWKEYEKRPNNIDVNLLLSAALYHQGQYNKAKVHIDVASRTNSKNSELIRVKRLIMKEL